MSVKQRPRPRAFRPPGPNRPEQILAAASRAIQQRGFANTRIADIAGEAGMSTGAIHYYFDVKDEVLIAALKWASERLFDRLDELAEAAGSERERLAQVLEVAVPVPGPRRGEYVLWIELWVRALQEPSLLARLRGALEALAELLLRAGAARRRSRASSRRCPTPTRWPSA